MSSPEKLQDLGNKFKDLLTEIKGRANPGLSLRGVRSGELVIKETSTTVESVGTPGNIAFRDVFTGTSIPTNDLGRDGDLYFRIQAAVSSKMSRTANWHRMYTHQDSVMYCTADGADYIGRTTNGTTWDMVPMPYDTRWSGIAGDQQNRIIAVSFRSEVAVSNDGGQTWEAGESLMEGPQWNHIAYANGKYVATAYGWWGAKDDSELPDVVGVTTDGTSWTYHNLPERVYGGGVAGGASGFVMAVPGQDYAFYSPNGTDWSKVTLPVKSTWVNPQCITTNGKDEYVMMGQGSNYSIHSTNGRNWTLAEMPFTGGWSGNQVGSGEFGRHTWLAVPGHSSSIALSFNSGHSWVELAVPEAAQWHAIGYINGRYVFAGHNTDSSFYINEKDLMIVPQRMYDHTEPPVIGGDPEETPGKPPMESRPDAGDSGFTLTLSSTPGDLTLAALLDNGTASWVKSEGSTVGRWYNQPLGCDEISYESTSQQTGTLRIVGDTNLISKLALFNYPTLTVRCQTEAGAQVFRREVSVEDVIVSPTEVVIDLTATSHFSPHNGRYYFMLK